MRITENRLRSIIRSVIKESWGSPGYDFDVADCLHSYWEKNGSGSVSLGELRKYIMSCLPEKMIDDEMIMGTISGGDNYLWISYDEDEGVVTFGDPGDI